MTTESVNLVVQRVAEIFGSCLRSTTAAAYSFRAECQVDALRLFRVFGATGIAYSIEHMGKPDRGFPDVVIEMRSLASLHAIRTAMRSIADGHVMVQTLQACRLADNSLERDYSL